MERIQQILIFFHFLSPKDICIITEACELTDRSCCADYDRNRRITKLDASASVFHYTRLGGRDSELAYFRTSLRSV